MGYSLYDSGDGTYLTFAEQSNAAGWNIQTSFNPPGATSQALSAVSCAAASACTAVGYYFSPASGTTSGAVERRQGGYPGSGDPAGCAFEQFDRRVVHQV